jgi:STE24 endopeptidase
LPLVILCVFLGNWLALPVASAVSRHFERQADQAALDIAKQPEAFIAAEVKLVRDNIGNPAPAPWNVWLFATHPPAVERIEMARRWAEQTPAGNEKNGKVGLLGEP